MLEKMLKDSRTKLLVLALAFMLAGFAACGNDAGDEGYEDYEPETVATYEPEEYPEYAEAPEEVECDEEPDTVYETIHLGSEITGAIHRVEYGGNVAYLFGTLHASMEHWFPLADIVEDALRRSDVVLLEVSDVDIDTWVMLETLMKFIFLPDGQKWEEFLPNDAYEHFVALLSDWDIAYETVNTMNPVFLMYNMTLGLLFGMADLAIDFEFSVDLYIANAAHSLGLPVLGLETEEQQMELVFNPPFEVLLAMVMDFTSPDEMVIELHESEELMIDDLARLYEENDFQTIIDSWARTLGPEHDSIFIDYTREVVLNWRSTYYAEEIARLLRETEEPTTFFVAVGLSHIIRHKAGEGFTDIVQQLTLDGFTVVPIWR